MRLIGKTLRLGLTAGVTALGLTLTTLAPSLAGEHHEKGIPFQQEIALPCNTAKGMCSKKLYAVPGDEQLEVRTVICQVAAATDIVYRAFLELDTTPPTYVDLSQQWLKVHSSILFTEYRLKAEVVAPPGRMLTLSIRYEGDHGKPRRAVANVHCSVHGSLVALS